MRVRRRFGVLLLLLAAASRPASGQAQTVSASQVDEAIVLWVCPTHGDQRSDAPDRCPICNRAFEARRVATLWSCPMHAQVVGESGGRCPICSMALASASRELLWTCSDHPDVILPAPGACPKDGRPLVAHARAMAHGDHNPRHGGLMFMAPDGFHHLEGTLAGDGSFRVYFYDDFTRPKDASGFRAHVDGRALTPAADGSHLALPIGTRPLPDPLELVLKVRFDPAQEREERFDFVFSRADAPALPTPATPAPSAGAADPLGAIEALGQRVEALVRSGAWPDVFVPALEAKDLALALEAREGPRVALPVKTIVRAAWLLDLHGDHGRQTEVEAAQRLFAEGVAALKVALGR